MRIAAFMFIAAISACSHFDQTTVEELGPPSGRIELEAVQAAFIGSGTAGKGTLYFKGKAYPFTVGGLGVGGIGASTINATGTVYSLNNIGDFPGAYGTARYGLAFGDVSGGEMWLKNPSGVVIQLDAERTGLILSLGADGMVISLSQ